MAKQQKAWEAKPLVSTTDPKKTWTPESRAEETNLIMSGRYIRKAAPAEKAGTPPKA